MLKKLVCENCGGNSFEKDGRFWTCDHCQTEHVLHKDRPEFKAAYLLNGTCILDDGAEVTLQNGPKFSINANKLTIGTMVIGDHNNVTMNFNNDD